jgi:pimeloyl-ACP methyl ester carboxylesterase
MGNYVHWTDFESGDSKLNLFHNLNINVFAINYRGYGQSNGSPSPDMFENDIKAVINFIKQDLKFTGKIGVQGTSLGG